MRAARTFAILLALLAPLAGCGKGSRHGGGGSDDPLAPVPTSGSTGTTTAPAGRSGYGPPVLLGQVSDPDVDESSGLVASRRNPGLYWTHNDSGDGPYLYCVQGHGEPCGTWKVNGAENIDWEDISAGPGPQPGMPYLYAGDIGDNDEDRRDVVVYRVTEPAASASQAGPPKRSPGTAQGEAIRLRYPDGPHNAEALMVHPATGDLYIVVKEADPGVYVARAPLSTAATTTMTKIATLPLGRDGTLSLVTGGDIAPVGRRVALCDYEEGFELRLPAGDTSFDDIWTQAPQPLTLGLRPQGESIAYRLDGRALLTTSERPHGLPDPLYEIDQQ